MSRVSIQNLHYNSQARDLEMHFGVAGRHMSQQRFSYNQMKADERKTAINSGLTMSQEKGQVKVPLLNLDQRFSVDHHHIRKEIKTSQH